MTAPHDSPVQPVAPVTGTRPVQPSEAESRHAAWEQARQRTPTTTPGQNQSEPADASTSGGIPAAYAQLIVDPDTHQVIVKIRDAATDKVLTEVPSQAVQAADKSLRAYADFLARHRAMTQTTSSANTGEASIQ